MAEASRFRSARADGDPSGPVRLAAALVGGAALLVALSLATRYAAYRADVTAPGSQPAAAWHSVMKLFDVNSESNLPTWYSASLLLAAAVGTGLVAVLVARAGGRDAGRWWLLAGILALLSLDEASALHERLGGPAEDLLGSTGVGPFVWVLPAGVLALVAGLSFLGFLGRLPAPVRRHLLGAGALFLTGAVLLEAVSGLVLEAAGDRAAYLLVTAAEEGTEMAAAAWFLVTALRCLTTTRPTVTTLTVTLTDALHHTAPTAR